jgi:CTP:molybdopterin cytidylyltransferase MocA
MKAILLAGGKGTRLRPLTIHTPKPIVPIFDRPFLHYQLDLIKRVPEIDGVILSLNYQPRRIEEMFGDGSSSALNLRYVVEPAPLGTAGAVRYAAQSLHDSVVVFNGDILTQIDLAASSMLPRDPPTAINRRSSRGTASGKPRRPSCSRRSRIPPRTGWSKPTRTRTSAASSKSRTPTRLRATRSMRASTWSRS